MHSLHTRVLFSTMLPILAARKLSFHMQYVNILLINICHILVTLWKANWTGQLLAMIIIACANLFLRCHWELEWSEKKGTKTSFPIPFELIAHNRNKHFLRHYVVTSFCDSQFTQSFLVHLALLCRSCPDFTCNLIIAFSLFRNLSLLPKVQPLSPRMLGCPITWLRTP